MFQINPSDQDGCRQQGQPAHLSTELFFTFSLMNVYGFSNGGGKHPKKLVARDIMHVGALRASRICLFSTQGESLNTVGLYGVKAGREKQHPGRILKCKLNSELCIPVVGQNSCVLSQLHNTPSKMTSFPCWGHSHLTHTRPAHPDSALYAKKC